MPTDDILKNRNALILCRRTFPKRVNFDPIVVDIGGVSIADGNTLDEQIAADERRQKIEKEIAKLEKQARAEKQPKKKFELVQQIKRLKEELI